VGPAGRRSMLEGRMGDEGMCNAERGAPYLNLDTGKPCLSKRLPATT